MRKDDQSGSVTAVASIAILSVLLIAVAVFATSAYRTGQDYKNNSDKKAAAAVEAAKKEQAKELQDKFNEDYKRPNKTYIGPIAYGSVKFDYPKTWSAYVVQNDNQPIDGYFHPDVVPGVDGGAAFALRLEVVNDTYSSVVDEYEQLISSGKLKAKAYVPPKMEKKANVQPGLRLTGDLSSDEKAKNGAMVIIQVRDKTLKIYTESTDYIGDFDNIILASLSFSP